MEKRTQLQYLEQKYGELSAQYLSALNNGTSLREIRDLCYVLDCISTEIIMLKREVLAENGGAGNDYAASVLREADRS